MAGPVATLEHALRLHRHQPDILAALHEYLHRRTGGLLDELPLPAQVGATRTGGLDLNKPRMRAVLAAALAPAILSIGFPQAARRPSALRRRTASGRRPSPRS